MEDALRQALRGSGSAMSARAARSSPITEGRHSRELPARPQGEGARRPRARPATPTRSGSARGSSRSSSASPTSSTTCRSSSRPRGAEGIPSTTSSSLARRDSGKTTLAGIVAQEMGVGLRDHIGPVLARAGDLAATLDGPPRGRRPVHRRDPPPRALVEELLYPAMEDGKLDVVLGQGPDRPVDPPRPAAVHASSVPRRARGSWRRHCVTASASSAASTSTSPRTSSGSWRGSAQLLGISVHRGGAEEIASEVAVRPDREPAPPSRPRRRRGPGPGEVTREVAAEGSRCSASTARARQGRPSILESLAVRFDGNPSASDPGHASARSPRRSRRPTSRT